MCGIWGTNDPQKFFELSVLNASRGDYSTGCLFKANDDLAIWKQPKALYEGAIHRHADLLLGHSRAPTSATSTYTPTQTHPFSCADRVYWAHNGIISNIDSLEDEYEENFDVDSKWIGYLYYQSGGKLKTAIERIEGTYGIWLYDVCTQSTYLVRGDNILYLSNDRTSFSSAPFEDSFLIENDVIYVRRKESEIFEKTHIAIAKKQRKYFIPDEHIRNPTH